ESRLASAPQPHDEIRHDCKIDDERADANGAGVSRDLVDLERHEGAGDEHGEPFGPASPGDEAHALDDEDARVDEHARAQPAQMPLVEGEDPLHDASDVAAVRIDVQLPRPALEHIRGIAA